MNNNIQDVLNHIDDVIETSRVIYEKGAQCALYFNLLQKFDIHVELIDELEIEIAKRDHEKAMISHYQGKIYNVTITTPWRWDDLELIKSDKVDDLTCIIQDLTPTNKPVQGDN